ncbi:MAG: FAA hydrolase family protein [Candidatus Thermochlorobacter aerophilum]|jgi:2-keto-4-pentenoate hydratase/2-oxohepta-3-ene-1,7-dioic acid hydratase (catechol pathway)|uniref:FAA hydrolase family protein n=1 Tax=Candidatus Thermochlorobacter aerophilus TaxID=1868324 RepID=A0A395LWK7_9BACT|nr:MAG: FAA hydrolase family protein [Candidatus Thermochlorobacter aerophilum]
MASVLLDTKTVAVGTIYCIGKNYEAHAKEMRNKLGLEFSDTAATQEPIVFSKPASSLIHSGESITIPRFRGKAISNEMHHELELVVLIGRRAVEVSEENAADYVAGFGVGLDMTLRDRQTEAKRNGQPWLLSKGFRTAAVISNFVPLPLHKVSEMAIELKKNGERVQFGYPREMTFSISFLISYLSHIFGLEAGDLIFTGTPEGVGKVQTGDKLTAILYSKTDVLAELHTQVS